MRPHMHVCVCMFAHVGKNPGEFRHPTTSIEKDFESMSCVPGVARDFYRLMVCDSCDFDTPDVAKVVYCRIHPTSCYGGGVAQP